MASEVQSDRRPGLPQGLTVIAAGFLPILAIVTLFPAVPSIIDHFSGDPRAGWMVPSMVSAPGLAIAAIAPFAGILVDRFGRRRLLVWSTFFYGLVGAAPILLDDLDAIYASRLLLGVTEAAILTTLNTLIGDYWDDKGRRNWLTMQGVVGPALASLMIFLAGILTGVRWNGVFLIYLVALPIWLAMLACLYEPRSDRTARAMLGMDDAPARGAFPWGSVLTIGAVTLFASVLYYVFIINGGLAFREVGIATSEELGRLTSIPSLFIVAGAGLFWLTGRLGAPTQIAIFLGLFGVGLGTIGLAPDWRWMVAGLVLQQTGAGMAIPTLIAWAQSRLPFEHRGRGMGVWTACFFFGQFASPLIVGLVRAATGSMQGAFAAAGLLALLGAAAASLLAMRARPARTPVAPAAA